MSSIKDHFKMRAERYDSVSTSWVNNQEILNIIRGFVDCEAKDNCKLLEVGAGTGVVSKYLCDNCNKNISITDIDISEEMLRRVDDNRIRTVIADIKSMPFADNEFDIVVSRQCLHYISDVESALKQISRVLSGDGVFILSQIVPYSKETKDYWEKIIKFRQPLRYNYYTSDEWSDVLMKNGFVLVDSKMCYHWASIKNWVEKYKIQDVKLIEKYRGLYIDASEQFKELYSVQIDDEDIKSKSYWINIMARNQKGK